MFIAFFYIPKAILNVSDGLLHFSYYYKYEVSAASVTLAVVYLLLSVVAFFLGFLSACSVRSRFAFVSPMPAQREMVFALSFSFAVSFYAFSGLLSSGVGDFFLSVASNRFEVFQDSGMAMLLLGCYKLSFLVYVWNFGGRKGWVVFALLWMPALFFDAATGSRGKVVVENVAPVIFILSVRGHLKVNGLKVVVTASFLAYLSSQVTAYFRGGIDHAGGVLAHLRGPEFPYIDTLAFSIEKGLGPTWGQSILSAIFYPISWVFGVGVEGASSQFTREYFSSYYYPNKIEIAFSILSESYISFGFFGVFIIFLYGWLVSWLFRVVINNGGGYLPVILAFCLIRLVLLVRNDLFNNLIPVYFSLIYLSFLYFIMRLGGLVKNDR
tara:strand:+ start:6523 stop:7668 length:1146 start_codon:yes stop_codon:yes gene_type:complete